MTHERLRLLYDRLFERYGPQGWWPGEGPFEVIVGAILTQRTTWVNAERAMDALRDAGCTTFDGMLSLPAERLERLIRPAGFYRAKARTLHAMGSAWGSSGGRCGLFGGSLNAIRDRLLSIRGIGPETADAILLYAGQRPSFVVDAYTQRLLRRLGWIETGASYDGVRRMFMNAIPPDVSVYGEYHALIVRHGKAHCRSTPVCDGCPVRGLCPAYPASSSEWRLPR